MPLLRAIAFRTNLVLVIPAFILVHVFGAMLADREYPGDAAPGWLDSAFAITTIATIAALVLLALQFWVLRRVRAGHLGGWQARARHLPRAGRARGDGRGDRADGREADVSRHFLPSQPVRQTAQDLARLTESLRSRMFFPRTG